MYRRVLPRKLTFKVIGVSGLAGDEEAILADGHCKVSVSGGWMTTGERELEDGLVLMLVLEQGLSV